MGGEKARRLVGDLSQPPLPLPPQDARQEVLPKPSAWRSLHPSLRRAVGHATTHMNQPGHLWDARAVPARM